MLLFRSVSVVASTMGHTLLKQQIIWLIPAIHHTPHDPIRMLQFGLTSNNVGQCRSVIIGATLCVCQKKKKKRTGRVKEIIECCCLQTVKLKFNVTSQLDSQVNKTLRAHL